MKEAFVQSYKERFQSSLGEISNLYNSIYAHHLHGRESFGQLLEHIEKAFAERPENLKQRDLKKLKTQPTHWFLSNEICGMSLYVDRFCGSINTLKNKLDYFEKLGINLLHLMPVFENREGASDGGYAVSDFEKVDKRFGTLDDLKNLEGEMRNRDMSLMLDIVQLDINYDNPQVFTEMVDTIFFSANLGVDILRIDISTFIWKEKGTPSRDLPQVHTLLQLVKQCIWIAAPGMAIVAPNEMIKYFGEDNNGTKECDFVYNATQMALQWDALATGDTRILMAAQQELLKKPFGTSWITYTRDHDGIGLSYDDHMIDAAGYDPYEHRKFIKDYYSGNHYASSAKGALFSVNEKTGDARISGSLASLCGLETAINTKDVLAIELSIQKILMMQAMSFFIGGIPMIFYGDESGHLNDHSYLNDPEKKDDNRWMLRPIIDWNKNENINKEGTIEHNIYTSTQKLIELRKKLPVIADKKNLTWLRPHNIHVAGFLRAWDDDRVYCLFNFSHRKQSLTWYAFKENGMRPSKLYDHWSEKYFDVGTDNEYFVLPPYSFFILEPK